MQKLTKSDKMQTSSVTPDKKAIYKISAQYLKACTKKSAETNILCLKRAITHSKNWRNPRKRELDLWHMITRPYTKFQLNTSKNKEKKCGKPERMWPYHNTVQKVLYIGQYTFKSERNNNGWRSWSSLNYQ